MSQRGLMFSVGALVVAGGVIWWPANAMMKKRAVADHFSKSEALTKRGQWDEAAIELKKAIEIEPDYVEARDALATILSETERVDEAKQVFDAGLARLPKNDFLLHKAASTMFAASRYEDCIVYAQAGDELSPGARDFAYVHALSLEKLGRTNEAHEVYVKAVKSNPGDIGLVRSAERTSPEGIKKQQQWKQLKMNALSKKPKASSTGVSISSKPVSNNALKAIRQ
jgi:tetratricopeptide (TPR) repeat protein